MATVRLVTGAFAALVVTLIATKGDFCPVVYMDREQGMDLVGEAFPGAVMRSVERRDVLSLPRPRSGSVHVRMVDEARQTQYVDEVTLLVAEHPPDLRALVAHDRGIVLVGAAGAPTSVLDELGHDAAPLLTARDGRVWQTDLGEAASGAPLRDELTATFAAPPVGTPVLEIVGGNTEWLEVVLGRVARAMGDQLPRYRALGDRPEGAAWIASWRERQRVDLSVDAFMAGTWHRIATVPSPGAATLRHVAVPLPDQLAGSGTLRVRLSSGEGFWRIDQLALSVLAPSLPAMRRLAPSSATGVAGRNEREAIADADGRYAMLEDLGSVLDLRFDVAPPEEGTSQSLFLSSRGYYERQAALEGRSSPELLARLADDNGSLGRLSRDLAREYLARWRPSETPELGETTSRRQAREP